MTTTQGRTIFSFVVDRDPRFVYEAWHLARSLIEHCGGDPSSIHVQFLPEVNARRRHLFGEIGCHVHEIARFGDGRYCNKLNQLESLIGRRPGSVIGAIASTLSNHTPPRRFGACAVARSRPRPKR